MVFPIVKQIKKKSSLEKREEQQGKDLDGDGEKGESATHRAKVLGGSNKKGPVKGTSKKAQPCGCPVGQPCKCPPAKRKK